MEEDLIEPDEYALTFARKILRVRTLAGLNQMEFGDLVSVAQSQVTRWENGRGWPRPAQMYQLIGSLRRTLPWLTADWLIDPNAVEPEDASPVVPSFEEQIVQVLIRDLGFVETRRRLLGIRNSSVADDPINLPPPRIIRSITRRAEDLPAPRVDQEKNQSEEPPRRRGRPRSRPENLTVAEQWVEDRKSQAGLTDCSPGARTDHKIDAIRIDTPSGRFKDKGPQPGSN